MSCKDGRRGSPPSSSGKPSRSRLLISSGNQPSTSTGKHLISAQQLLEKARRCEPVIKITYHDHELATLLHRENLDDEFNVHEKIRKLKPRPPIMGNELSGGTEKKNTCRRRKRTGGRESREASPASSTCSSSSNRKSSGKKGEDADEDYKVARIKTAKLTDEGPKFLVEWSNYPCEDTWESYENCGECEQMDRFESWWPTIEEEDSVEVLAAFQLFVKKYLDPNNHGRCDMAVLLKLSETKLQDLKRDPVELDLQKVALMKKVRQIYYPLLWYDSLENPDGSKMKTKTLITLATKRLKVQRLDEIIDLKEKRAASLKKLRVIKSEINEAIESLHDGPPVEIENMVDDDVFKTFNYVKDYHSVDVNYDDQTCLTCNCGDKCVSDKCPCLNEHPRAYDQFKFLVLELGKPIYECNPRCSCGTTCKMRVISEGRKFKLCIFKTDNGRGWGLKTLERIQAKRFVVHYTGELLTVSTSEKRERERKEYNRYLFALDYAPVVGIQGLEENVIDASEYGNLSRFINHSVSVHSSAKRINLFFF